MDSLTIMDVIMELEDRFDVTIPMNVAADIVTRRPGSPRPWFRSARGAEKLPTP